MDTKIVDSIIVDLNELPKQMMEGQYIQTCTIIARMAQNLFQIREELQANSKVIESLKAELRASGKEVIEKGVEKSGS